MPSLGGFLKKKRTREGNSDPSSSNPTSPVTPTASRPFDRSSLSRARTSSSAQAGAGAQLAQTSTASTTASQQHQHQQQAQAASEKLQQQQQQQQPLQMNPNNNIAGSGFAAATGGNDIQNLPTLNNLMNPQQQQQQQQAGAANNFSTVPYPALMGQSNPHLVNASPGTDPEQLKQQQQQAHPVPTMQPQQQQQQALSGQSTPQGHDQSQTRATKGKYSLGDFDILRTLGTGSFGRVHLVQSKHNQRFYAIKVLKKAQVVKMKQVEHTNDERRMLSDVKHPFLITLWGTFQDWKNLYMVMDFVEGGELFSLLRKSGVSCISSAL